MSTEKVTENGGIIYLFFEKLWTCKYFNNNNK